MPPRDDAFFWEGVDRGELLVQACADCGTMRHPPAPMCAACRSLAWEARAMSGRGTVYTWLLSKHPTREDAAPRTVVLVDLEEGPRFVSNMAEGEGAEVGMPVELVFGEVRGARLPLFRRAAP